MKFKVLGITFIVAVMAAIVAGVYYLQPGNSDNFQDWPMPVHKSQTSLSLARKGILTGHVTSRPEFLGALLIYKADGKSYVTNVSLNEQDSYSIELDPGVYVIKFPDSALPANQIQVGKAMVKFSETTTFDFNIELKN